MCSFSFLSKSLKRIEKEEKINVTATVSNMEYSSSYVTICPMFTGKTLICIPQMHPSCYLVTISYENVSETFDDINLYERVKKGYTIQMILYKGYDKESNLIRQTLRFSE